MLVYLAYFWKYIKFWQKKVVFFHAGMRHQVILVTKQKKVDFSGKNIITLISIRFRQIKRNAWYHNKVIMLRQSMCVNKQTIIIQKVKKRKKKFPRYNYI